MGLLITIIALWFMVRLIRAIPRAAAISGMRAHRLAHSDHRIETYLTPRGSMVYHCWGAGEVCGERWKVKS